MIVRIFEAEVRPGKADRLIDFIRTTLYPRVLGMDGFMGAEFLKSMEGENRVIVISRWRDEQAIAAYAGPHWRARSPHVDQMAADYLAHPSHVYHFLPVEADSPAASE